MRAARLVVRATTAAPTLSVGLRRTGPAPTRDQLQEFVQSQLASQQDPDAARALQQDVLRNRL